MEATMNMMNRMELNNNELDMVNGAFFTKNSISEDHYHECGIRTEYHTFIKDEFWLPDGTKTDMHGADAYVKSVVGVAKFNEWNEKYNPQRDCDDPYGGF